MSTANKLSYLNDTKSLLRTSLNKFGSSILSTDTFRSYDTKLNDIYDKLPKVTQSGAGFTLENVQNGQVDDFKMLGVDLIQDGEPSPDYPQEIKVVEGRQVITDKGKNLLNPYTEPTERYGITASYNQNTHVYTFNGTCTRDNITFILSNNKINFTTQVTKSITFWVGGSCTNSCDIRHFDSNYNSNVIYSIVNISSTNNKISKTSNFTFENPINYATIRFNNGSVANNLQIKVMVTDDDNTDYEPYYNPVSYNIDLQLANIYLAKIPNTDYKNKIYKNNGNWYYEENVKKIVLDGSEDEVWTIFKNSIILNGLWSGKPITMCDSFKETTNELWVSDSDDYRGMCSSLNTAGQFRCMPLNDMTLSDFKTWLSTHNVTLWYPLATPVTTQITNTTLINQLEAISVHTGTNIITISNSNNIIPEIEITRLKELEKLA